MILATKHGNAEVRTAEFGSTLPPARTGWLSSSGIPVTQESAYGLPAVSNVIRSPAEIIASLPFMVYRAGDVRERADGSWQYRLLHDQPAADSDPFRFFYDLALSVEATQNAFVEKVRANNGQVVELYVLDPQRVSVYRDRSGVKRFDYWQSPGERVSGLTSERILHVRGFSSTPGALAGVSLLEQHREPLGAALAQQAFEGDYFRNGGVPPFWYTGAQNRQHAQDLIDLHNTRHQGAGNQWKVGALWGQADVKSIPISMEDASFAEAKRLSIEDACRIWRWPKTLLELSGEQGPVDENAWTARFLKFYLLPRLKRIEQAFNADAMFAGTDLFGEFLTAALERADFVTRVRGYKDARQGGWISANEIRRLENLPPLDGGDELQMTPVGGAPNPSQDSFQSDDEERSYRRQTREDSMRDVHVHLPEIRMPENVTAELKVPDVIVNVPEQRAPEVTVNVPEQREPVINVAPPEVTVNVPEQPAPVVNVENLIELPPDKPKVLRVERDAKGRISEATIEQED